MPNSRFPDWYNISLSDREKKLYRKLARYNKTQLIEVLEQNDSNHYDLQKVYSQCTKIELIGYIITNKVMSGSLFDTESPGTK